MPIDSTNWSNDVDEDISSKDSVPEDGPGGGIMSIWEQDVYSKLNNLAGSSFDNQSSFNIPGATFGAGGWGQQTVGSALVHHGNTVTANILNADSRPQPGTSRFSLGGETVYQETVEGAFRSTGIPNLGVMLGESIPGDNYNWEFAPSIDGLSITESSIGPGSDIGVIKYGSVRGKIETYDGEPVSGMSVTGKGAAAVTGSKGSYEFQGPGGTSVTLKTLSDTYSFGVDISKGEVTEKNITLSKLIIEVLDTELQPVDNSPVKINGRTRYTDSDGRIVDRAPELKDYDIIAQGKFGVENFTIDRLDRLYKIQIAPGITPSGGEPIGAASSSAILNVVDSQTGSPVTDVDAVIDGEDVVSLSDTNGKVVLLSSQSGSEAEVVISGDDDRYEKESVTMQIPNNGINRKEVELERASKTPTY